MRKRAAAAAVLCLALMLSGAGLLLLVMLQSSLAGSAMAAATQRRDDIVRQLADEGLADVHVLVGPSVTDAQLVQVIDARGKVVADTRRDRRGGALLEPISPGGTYASPLPGFLQVMDNDDLLISAAGAALPEGNYTVAVAASTSVQRDAIGAALSFILAAGPILLAAGAAVMWRLAGHSLHPVERIRSTVATINRGHLAERVEVPPTGDEIQHLAVTMNEMLDRLHRSDRAQRQFVANASHELRSPLAALAAGLEIVAADRAGDVWRQTAGSLHAQALRMGLLVDDLLTLAKLDDPGLTFAMADVDLDDVVHEEASRLKIVSRHVVKESLAAARVTGDAARLGQVVRNILMNADRHAATTITITLTVDDQTAVVRIDNDGDRIPASERDRIFERFVRLDQSRSRENGGSGLGLAISREIVTAHQGTIHVAETVEHQTRLVLLLPLQGASG